MPLTKIPASMLNGTFATQENLDAAIATEVTDRNSAISALAGAASVIFNTSGVWTKPASGELVRVRVWGGGGGASRFSALANMTGGAGGGYCEKWFARADLGATETVTIGAGGAGAVASGAGTTGGTSSFGAWIGATGGAPGLTDGTTTPLGGYPTVGGLAVNTASNPYNGGAGNRNVAAPLGAIFGGAGGTCASYPSFLGYSINGGNGGVVASPGGNGQAPGGGGATGNAININGGNGAAGRVTVDVF